MKPFRFRAAALLEQRRREYDAARADMARLVAAEHQVAQRLTEAEAKADAAEADYRALLSAASDLDQIGRHRNWIARQHTVVQDTRWRLDERRAAVAAARAMVLERFKRVRTLERLRDRAWSRYADAVRREETNVMNAHATMQFARRTLEGVKPRDR